MTIYMYESLRSPVLEYFNVLGVKKRKLDQYALSLHGTTSDMLELVVGRHDFPSAARDTAAPVPRVRRASAHMEAMCLWRPSHDPGGPLR